MFRPNQNHWLALHSACIESTDFVFKINSHVLENFDLENSIFYIKSTHTSGWCSRYLGWNKIIDQLHLFLLHVTITDSISTKFNFLWFAAFMTCVLSSYRSDLSWPVPFYCNTSWLPYSFHFFTSHVVASGRICFSSVFLGILVLVLLFWSFLLALPLRCKTFFGLFLLTKQT